MPRNGKLGNNMAKASSKKNNKQVAKKSVAKKPVKKVAKKATKTQAKKAVKKVTAKKVVKAAKKPVLKKAVAKKPAPKAVKKPVAKAAPKQVKKPAPAAKVVAAKPAPKAVAPAPVKAAAAPQRPNAKKHAPDVFVPQNAKEQKALYKVGNHVVYPTHGVGKIIAEETQSIGEIELRLLVINFEKDKMTLRVPMHRASAAGLRPISGSDKMKEVYVSLKSKAKISRGMWSRRAQEYEAKINSGNILLISEVVRDLHQNVDQSERSYSERMIYENALNRLVGEVAAAEGTDSRSAHDKLMKLLRAKVAAAAALKEAA
jgi:CarD family transcriptional regulator